MIKVTGFEQAFDVMRYPASESHVEQKKDIYSGTVIQASHVRNFEDLMNCVTAQRILRHNGVEAQWFIPYFPFGRHDRRRSNWDGLELTLALEIAKELNPTTLDPHSDVLGQMRHIPQSEVVAEWRALGLFDVKIPQIVIPDQGATKKTDTWLNGMGSIQGRKRRDPNTGQLSGFAIGTDPIFIEGNDCIIIDDICDGGGTFLGLANELLSCKPNSLTLAVTHGLFTKGTDILFEKFDRIFSTGPFVSDGVIRAKHHLLFEKSFQL